MTVLNSGKNLVYTKAVIAKYLTEGTFNFIVNRSDDVKKRRKALEITAKNSRKILDNLGCKIQVTKSSPDLFERNYFMVCNHMSYIDILVLSSCQPALFVTSVEMEKTFFLGDMAKLGGSFFVDRINRRKIKQEVEALVGLVNSGFNLFIFPEGTSSNGLGGVMPFKKSLFRVAKMANVPVLPVSLRYESINGEPFSEKNCDKIAWYGDMTFAPHFLKLMDIKELKVSVDYLEPINTQDYPDHGSLAGEAFRRVSEAYTIQH